MALDVEDLRKKVNKARYEEHEARYLRENLGDQAALEMLRQNEEKFGPAPTVDMNDEAAVSARVQELKAVLEGVQRELGSLGIELQISLVNADTDGEEEEEAPYEEWSVEDLDAELKKRMLPLTGKKAEKVDRLYTDDERVVAEAEAAARQS